MFPVMLDLSGRPVLVVGGGGVALRKVNGLLGERAAVSVVAPVVVRGLVELGREGVIRVEERPYRPGEAAGYALVLAATDDRDVNRRVAEDAAGAGVFANVADDPELCSFHLPARVRRGSLQLAIGSDGGAPFAVRRLRQLLERRLGEEWGAWMEGAVELRRRVRALGLGRLEAEARYDAFFARSVDGERLRARRLTRAESSELLGPHVARPEGGASRDLAPTCVADPPAGGRDERRSAHRTGPSSAGASGGGRPSNRAGKAAAPDPSSAHGHAPAPGLVSLVGAGPGDAGLLTCRGRRRLLAADAVVYDRLAAGALPCDLPRGVELHGVGKEAGHHPVPQEEINELLVRLARAGKATVRLKGGDPCVFGRGGEEAEALEAAGVPWEIVPGVTAGVAVPAYAGIPVTHRGEAVRLTLVTAHESTKCGGPQVDWAPLARDPHATLVGYMGLGTLPRTAAALLEAGMSPAMPAALVSQGTTAAQRSIVATLGELPAVAAAAELPSPALFVIGPTVRHAEALAWATRRPLWGERLGVFAPAGELGAALDLAGAEVVEVPLAVTPAARVVMAARPLTGFVLRTVEEVDALEAERDSPGWGARMTAWCVGPETARRAALVGLPGLRVVARGDATAIVGALVGGGGSAAEVSTA